MTFYIRCVEYYESKTSLRRPSDLLLTKNTIGLALLRIQLQMNVHQYISINLICCKRINAHKHDKVLYLILQFNIS